MQLRLGRLWKFLFGIPLAETTFARRGFRAAADRTRQHLERIGATFVEGYHAALLESAPASLGQRLLATAPELQGFAFEGAAMGLCLLDCLLPGPKTRLRDFLRGPGACHVYMVHVGVGWIQARLGERIRSVLPVWDPLLHWLTFDGFGFHEGYFHACRSVEAQGVPPHVLGYGRRAFDQGLGRSLWFVRGADVRRLPDTVNAFPSKRRPDLWSGVGLACAYAGGSSEEGIRLLDAAAGPFRPQLAQGVAFAAKVRQRAGNPAAHTELACRLVCGLSAERAAQLTDDALLGLSPDGTSPAFEIWRRRIQAAFSPARSGENAAGHAGDVFLEPLGPQPRAPL